MPGTPSLEIYQAVVCADARTLVNVVPQLLLCGSVLSCPALGIAVTLAVARCRSTNNRPLLSVWAYPLLYLVNDAPMAAELEGTCVTPPFYSPLERVSLGTHFVQLLVESWAF